MAGELLGLGAEVVVGVLSVVVGESVDVDVDVDLGGSSVTVPITQYALLVSSPGQTIPGFSFVRSSTESPQAAAKVSQVAS
jgi:hypothetical protein